MAFVVPAVSPTHQAPTNLTTSPSRAQRKRGAREYPAIPVIVMEVYAQWYPGYMELSMATLVYS